DALKRQGHCPLLIARGGAEAHGHEVLASARARGLRVVDRNGEDGAGVPGLLARLTELEQVDMVNLKAPVDPQSRRVLFRGADAVLANGARGPCGGGGLETRAAGGSACPGIGGEDYAVPGRTALVLQPQAPREFVGLFERLKAPPAEADSIRRAGRQ